MKPNHHLDFVRIKLITEKRLRQDYYRRFRKHRKNDFIRSYQRKRESAILFLRQCQHSVMPELI